MNLKTLKKILTLIFFTFLVICIFTGITPADTNKNKPDSNKADVTVTDQITREGLVVEFNARPTPGRSKTGKEIFQTDFIDLSFRITDANSGQPIEAQPPGVWMDLSKSWDGKHAINTSCKERVSLYLQGLIGIRPMIDLNNYFILVMNRDPSISVIDPITGISGITKLYAQINLKRPAADWTKSGDQNHLFVTMPLADQVALVNTKTFKVIRNVDAGKTPTRIALQPDEKYLWVGNNTETASQSGVTVLDTDTLNVAEFLPTGKGHHEIAFSDDSLTAFVSNREDGGVSVIDISRLKKIKDIHTGPLPISLAFSNLSRALYVADAQSGEIAVIEGRTFELITRIIAKPGLGPVRFSQDGRWAVALNSRENVAYAIDPATNRIVHTIAVGRQPYQVAFSRSFAYVRSLGTERVSMIHLSQLGKKETVPVTSFGAGAIAPEKAEGISIADAIVEAPGEAAVMVVSPADTTVYYYMEGMAAPMGNFRNYGHMPRAVQVVDRSMQEEEPGLYTSTVRLPEAGTYEVAFLFDSPSILHCFELAARPDPTLAAKGPRLAVQYLNDTRRVKAGETVRFEFRLTNPRTKLPWTDLRDVRVRYFVAPGGRRFQVPVRHTADGVYEAALPIEKSGAYYIYIACPSLKIGYTDLPYMSLWATAEIGSN